MTTLGLILVGYFFYSIFNLLLALVLICVLPFHKVGEIFIDEDGGDKKVFLFALFGLPLLLYYRIRDRKRKKREENIPDEVKRMI